MKARNEKGKIVSIEEEMESTYRAMGYDIVALNEESKQYEVIKYATGGRNYSAKEVAALHEELAARKAAAEV
ncbi:MAG: hypothetical protein ACRDBM_18200, partial [Sporomusa sp.]